MLRGTVSLCVQEKGRWSEGLPPTHPPGLQAVNWRLWCTGPRVAQLQGRPGSSLRDKTAPFLRVTAVWHSK